MARKILVLLGHPRSDSLCGSLAKAYEEGASAAGSTVRSIRIGELAFTPAHSPFAGTAPLEPDLQRLQDSFLWAEHVVLVYPIWWGAAPGQLKVALERILLPGIAFKYHDKGLGWDRLLKGRSGELLVTMDTPPVIHRWFFGAAGDRVMARRTLDFCGISPIRITHFGAVRKSTQADRAGWLVTARRLGQHSA